MHACLYLHTLYICMQVISMYICMYVHTYAGMNACMRVCIYARTYVCMHAYMFAWMDLIAQNLDGRILLADLAVDGQSLKFIC